MKMYFMQLFDDEGEDWLNMPPLRRGALLSTLKGFALESEFIHIMKPIDGKNCLRRFFKVPDELDSFTGFMFDLSLSHDIVCVDKDHDPCGKRNMLLVVRESSADSTNIEAEVMDTILRKYDAFHAMSSNDSVKWN